ncbi:MAG: S49 family peptidase [Chlamydiae bacterium CG10_big_fil_rev_8_21_14_0_10_42_34]|nr:MAG: S49 family peptidase [Chlamydiae bacterium CG10_big_fil_rev_8_21_14_0_10_42_34]
MEVQRESIFVSAIRSFSKVFFAVCGFFLALILISSIYTLLGDSTTLPNEAKTKVNYLPDANGKRESSETSPVILQLNVHGVIGEPKNLDTNTVQNVLLDSRNGSFKDNRVKGILLHMNTPGGTVVDSDNIYRMLNQYKERFKVPVFAYIDGLCASGGMYISSAADQVFAGPASIIGSVGVIIGPFFNVVDALNKIGVSSKTITQGLDKDMMTPFRPWKPDEDASLKAVTAYYYDQFVNIVTKARPRLDKEKLINVYGAQVFNPIKAQELGYVDHANSSRDETLLALLKEAGVDASQTYQVVELEQKSEWLSSLVNSKSPLFTGKIEHTIDTGAPAIREQIAYLYQPSGN